MANDIFKAIDQKKLTAMVLIDLSKAFDSIYHHNLKRKLQHLGISKEALKWFESYLTDRQQSTRVGMSLSELLTVIHGVPQGSILGPMLFSLYMNHLSSVVNFSRVKSYADDTKITFPSQQKTPTHVLRKSLRIVVISQSGAAQTVS